MTVPRSNGVVCERHGKRYVIAPQCGFGTANRTHYQQGAAALAQHRPEDVKAMIRFGSG
jgi:hypothetical protein